MKKSKDIKILINKEKLVEVNSKYQPALFLDRDGVVIKEMHHIKDPELVKLEFGIKELISKCYEFNWLTIIITNQSGIGRGFFTWNEYEEVTQQMLNLLGKENRPTAIYANSQVSQKIKDCWRKPSPNMLFQASKDLKIDLKNSILIGDRLSDLKAGINAGLSRTYHIGTGHGKKERVKVLKYFLDISHKNKCKEFVDNLYIESLNDLPNNLFEKSYK